MHKCLFYCIALVYILLIAFAPAVRAQDTEQAILTRAQQETAAGKWDEVVMTVESLRQQFPQSKTLSEGLVLLYQAHMHLQASEKAAAVGKEIVARWPKSDAVWQMVLITCKHKAKESPADAVAALDIAMKQDMLSTADRQKAQKLRFTYLEQAKSTQFLTDALETIRQLKPPVAKDDLLLAADLAKKAYPILLGQGKFDEAKAISDRMQELLAIAGNPQGGVQADQRVYLAALKGADAKRYFDTVIPIIKMVRWAETEAEVNLSVELVGSLYLELLRAHPYEEAKALHEGIQAAFTRLEFTPEKMNYETNAWYGALLSTHPEKLAQEMLAVVARMKEARTAEEVILRPEFTVVLYTGSFNKGQAEIAHDLHAQIQAFYLRFHLTDEAFIDRAQYVGEELLHLRATKDPRYLAEAPARLIDIFDNAPQIRALPRVWSLPMSYGLYRELFQSGRTAEATKLYECLQAAVTRLDPKSVVLNRNQVAYLTAFSQCDPEGFLNIFLLMMEKVGNTGTADMSLLVSLALPAYETLMAMGRMEDAGRIHEQLQAGLQRTPGSHALAATDQQRYLFTMAEVSPLDFLKALQPVLAGLAKVQTAEETMRLAPLVQTAYAPLNQSGCFLDARTAHDQLQTLFAKHNRTTEAEADKKKFKESISVQALEAILQLFKKAAIANDTAIAKKWLDELNAIAPESPQAARARSIWREIEKK